MPLRNVRTFTLQRVEDESGVSGTGTVAEGVEFSNGECAMVWFSHLPTRAFYPSVKVLEALHGHGGKTKIVWDS